MSTCFQFVLLVFLDENRLMIRSRLGATPKTPYSLKHFEKTGHGNDRQQLICPNYEGALSKSCLNLAILIKKHSHSVPPSLLCTEVQLLKQHRIFPDLFLHKFIFLLGCLFILY